MLASTLLLLMELAAVGLSEEAALPLGARRRSDPSPALAEAPAYGARRPPDDRPAHPLLAWQRAVVRRSAHGLLHDSAGRHSAGHRLSSPAADSLAHGRGARPPDRLFGYGPAPSGVGDEAQDELHLARRYP